jgi:hypothetical protein
MCYAGAILHVDCGYGLCPKRSKIFQFFARVAFVFLKLRTELVSDTLLASEGLPPLKAIVARKVRVPNGNIRGNLRRC